MNLATAAQRVKRSCSPAAVLDISYRLMCSSKGYSTSDCHLHYSLGVRAVLALSMSSNMNEWIEDSEQVHLPFTSIWLKLKQPLFFFWCLNGCVVCNNWSCRRARGAPWGGERSISCINIRLERDDRSFHLSDKKFYFSNGFPSWWMSDRKLYQKQLPSSKF